jgi:hypothetical protein
MPLLSAVSEGFSRHLFQDGDRSLILSTCHLCAEARIGSSYDGSLQQWEQNHVCVLGDPIIRDRKILNFPPRLT